MVSEHDRLQQKVAEIGARYIKRTLGELEQLRELITSVRNGTQSATRDIERLAHKIYGSGSMFGFETVSARARELELLASQGSANDEEFVRQLEACMSALDEQVREAARARGVT